MSVAAITIGARMAVSRRRTLGVFFLVVAAAMAGLFGSNVSDLVNAHFVFNLQTSSAIHVPDLVVPVRATAFGLAAVCAFLGAVQIVRGFERWAYVVLGLVIALFIFAFLAWAARSSSLSLVGMLQGTLVRATPLTLGAFSGLLCERAGVINVAIEGQMLVGAFSAALVASATSDAAAGILAGMLSGGLIAVILAVFAIRFQVDQVVVGIVLDLFCLGLTGFLYDRLMVPYQATLNSAAVLPPIPIPVLASIPVLGPILFDQNVFVYLMVVLLVVIQVMLFRTRWGLRVRAVGEQPRAADTAGIDVIRIRYINVILGGLLAGLAGSFFTLGAVGQFTKDMTSGRGFIALAAMIAGHWTPLGSLGAALLFGFADALQNFLSILNVPISSYFLLMAPYLATLLVVAGVVGRARPPAADGKPYVKQ
ncbi:MAG TPA: ABC transporter permease [Candidatus Micrarchaeaceae archaeon]|nr:ABC transporter permease [Candidatus Micrarchaeaceae archaeon]